MLIIIAIIILAILIQKKWQHMSMETDHPNPYYSSCKKTKEHSDDGLKNSGCEDINQEPIIYELLGEEHYDVPCKLSDEVPVVPKRENCANNFVVIKHENMGHLSSNVNETSDYDYEPVGVYD